MNPCPQHPARRPRSRRPPGWRWRRGIGIGIADLQGQWLDVDAGLERMLGYAAADLVGRPLSAFFDPDDKGLPGDFPAGLIERGAPALEARMRCLHRDGTAVWTQAIVHVVRDGQGAPHYLLAQLRDITAERAGDVERQVGTPPRRCGGRIATPAAAVCRRGGA
jgi:PAS domain S-box-containing protein